jgi:phenylalanyl-tRNA synthetase alpha chain
VAQDPIDELLRSFREESGRGVSTRAEFERLKGRYLGREKGLLPALFGNLKGLPAGERASFGQRVNAAKVESEAAIGSLAEALEARESA